MQLNMDVRLVQNSKHLSSSTIEQAALLVEFLTQFRKMSSTAHNLRLCVAEPSPNTVYPLMAALMFSTVAPGARAAAMMRASFLVSSSSALRIAEILSIGTTTAP